ncbi:MAG: hypothetical protein JRL30_07635 [Deltaproteobacteria bacterium]|nr:hypothetical protein [Deltaproteobacteria bacterium]
MFVIDTGTLRLQLEIVPVESLRVHEDVIPEQADELVLEFRNWANLQNPIIVDQNQMVLDGHHRAFVFRKLGFNYILVCKIDYFSRAVKLRYWFRRLGQIQKADALRRIIKEMNGDLRQVDDRETLKQTLEENRFQCGIQHGRFYGSIQFHEELVHDAVSAYDLVETIQQRLIRDGKTLDYVPCQAVQDETFCHKLRPDEVVIWTPHISKEMVVDAVKKDKRFAPKATRHLIPARPLNANIPISLFKEPISLKEINERLFDFLEKRKLRRFGPGQILNGRYYQEELYVFFDAPDSINRS